MDRMVASEAIDLGSTPSEPILLLIDYETVVGLLCLFVRAAPENELLKLYSFQSFFDTL